MHKPEQMLSISLLSHKEETNKGTEVQTRKMESLPSSVGRPTLITLSNRPLRKSAGSSMSSLFVAPTINT